MTLCALRLRKDIFIEHKITLVLGGLYFNYHNQNLWIIITISSLSYHPPPHHYLLTHQHHHQNYHHQPLSRIGYFWLIKDYHFYAIIIIILTDGGNDDDSYRNPHYNYHQAADTNISGRQIVTFCHHHPHDNHPHPHLCDPHPHDKYPQPTRISRVGKFGRVIVTAADGGSLLRSDIWTDLIFLEVMMETLAMMMEILMMEGTGDVDGNGIDQRWQRK